MSFFIPENREQIKHILSYTPYPDLINLIKSSKFLFELYDESYIRKRQSDFLLKRLDQCYLETHDINDATDPQIAKLVLAIQHNWSRTIRCFISTLEVSSCVDFGRQVRSLIAEIIARFSEVRTLQALLKCDRIRFNIIKKMHIILNDCIYYSNLPIIEYVFSESWYYPGLKITYGQIEDFVATCIRESTPILDYFITRFNIQPKIVMYYATRYDNSSVLRRALENSKITRKNIISTINRVELLGALLFQGETLKILLSDKRLTLLDRWRFRFRFRRYK